MAELSEHYDVVIVGGAMMGSSTAWWLSREPGFDGSVLVVERDPSYEHSSTSATNSCVRQQFSNEVNIRISQFTAEFIRTFPSWFDGADVPELATNYFGYLYLAADPAFAHLLEANQQLQASWGAATRILDRDELAASFPSTTSTTSSAAATTRSTRDISTAARCSTPSARTPNAMGSPTTGHRHRHRPTRWTGRRRHPRFRCVHLLRNRGERCRPRAARVAQMAGLELPVEPRKRFTYVFQAAEPLDEPLPLTIDPSGVHVRVTAARTWPAVGPTSTMPSNRTT